MKKSLKKIYIIEIIILLITVTLFFVKNVNNKYVLAIVELGILLFVLMIIYKKKRDTNLFRKQAFSIVCSTILFYYILVFLLGFLVGYSKTLFSLGINTLIHGLIPMLLITIIIEKIRFLIIKNNEDNRLSIILFTGLSIILSLIISNNNIVFSDKYLLFVFICRILIPTIAKEMLSTHMAKNYGYLPTITYKLIMNLYIYLVPIFTNLGDYLYSAIGIMIPFTIYELLGKFIETNDDVRTRKKKIKRLNTSFITIPIIVLLLVIISLVSGLFKYKMIAIVSNSMVPTYERGDTVITEKYNHQKLEDGEIIVYKKGNILVAHRIVKSKEDSGKIYFYTKGDANNAIDAFLVSEDEVEGIVKRVVKYIGYPTVWINELFRR